MPNALAVVAMAEAGSLLNAPDAYMDKIALGGNYPDDIVDLDATPEENVKAVATAKGVGVDLINVYFDRPRHADMIAQVRSAARASRSSPTATLRALFTQQIPRPALIFMGTGGAPGRSGSRRIRCTGGQMQGRLVLNGDDQKERAAKWELPISTVNTKSMKWPGDVVLSATGVTSGSMLSGISHQNGVIWTETCLRSSTGTIRWIKAPANRDKFHLND